MRTIIYADGYNLFYGVLSKSKYKWLDLHRLFDKYLVRTNSPLAEIIRIKFFTADAMSTMSSDPDAVMRQSNYLRMLGTLKEIEVIHGYHQKEQKVGHLVDPIKEAPHIKKLDVNVMGEKQTDVNIALHMYRDAILGNCEQVILCSNDADLAPALALIKDDCPHVHRGLILPRKQKNHRVSKRLTTVASWIHPIIRTEELENCQLPEHALTKRNRSIRKPNAWK